jgi:hypothetical protein
MAKRVPWLVGVIRSQKCNLSRGDECEDCRGLVETEDKPQLGRQKEARNFRVTWSGGVPWRLTRAGCMAVREEVRGVGPKPDGSRVDSRHVQHVFEVGDTFNCSMARMDLEGD